MADLHDSPDNKQDKPEKRPDDHGLGNILKNSLKASFNLVARTMKEAVLSPFINPETRGIFVAGIALSGLFLALDAAGPDYEERPDSYDAPAILAYNDIIVPQETLIIPDAGNNILLLPENNQLRVFMVQERSYKYSPYGWGLLELQGTQKEYYLTKAKEFYQPLADILEKPGEAGTTGELEGGVLAGTSGTLGYTEIIKDIRAYKADWTTLTAEADGSFNVDMTLEDVRIGLSKLTALSQTYVDLYDKALEEARTTYVVQPPAPETPAGPGM